MSRGSCVDSNPDQFFDRTLVREAITVCMSCPVRVECLIFATKEQVHGVWGGRTERQRYGKRVHYMPEETRRKTAW